MPTAPANDPPSPGMTGLREQHRWTPSPWATPGKHGREAHAVRDHTGRGPTGLFAAGRPNTAPPRPGGTGLDGYGAALLQALRPLGTVTSLKRGRRIFSQGDPVRDWYWLARGAVQLCTFSEDGKRQVAELVLPGDLFGFEARGERDATAEAARDVTFVSIPRARAEALIDADPSLSRAFREVACGRLRHAQRRLYRLGRTSAVERVASFLLEMIDRSSSPGGPIELFITRDDMADYLGLTSETVSRAFTELRRRGAVASLQQRSFRLVDRGLLVEAGAARRSA